MKRTKNSLIVPTPIAEIDPDLLAMLGTDYLVVTATAVMTGNWDVYSEWWRKNGSELYNKWRSSRRKKHWDQVRDAKILPKAES